jgi:hypothetical protein
VKLCLVSATLFATIVNAQTALPTEYPEGSVALTGDAIRNQLAGKVYTVRPSDGTTWRLEFTTNGYLFLDTSYGYRDSGKWRIDSNSWCAELKQTGNCSDLRQKGEVFYYKRTATGEVLPMTLR